MDSVYDSVYVILFIWDVINNFKSLNKISALNIVLFYPVSPEKL